MINQRLIDFRSDTVTQPTAAMREAMAAAAVGDDVYDDDPTTNELQALAAKMTGKEAALFVPSGTFGNQLCLYTHATRGDEVIVDENAHIIYHEAGASAVIAGVQLRAYPSPDGVIDPNEIEKRVRIGDDIHEPKTALICVENARADGRVTNLETLAEIRKISKRYCVPVHMDGARIFNAAAWLGVDAEKFAPYYDSMSFCLSKGLCAPVGSLIVGTEGFISRAKRKRKQMGGGMRQTGILAAAGLVALKEMVPRMKEDNDNAVYLAGRLAEIPGVTVTNADGIHISMVFFKISPKPDAARLVAAMRADGIVMSPDENGIFRFVTHYWVTRDDIDYAVERLKNFLSS